MTSVARAMLAAMQSFASSGTHRNRFSITWFESDAADDLGVRISKKTARRVLAEELAPMCIVVHVDGRCRGCGAWSLTEYGLTYANGTNGTEVESVERTAQG